MHFVFMGVSGSGKTTVAVRVAKELGLPFAEADDFHPRSNVDKMAAGIPLTDEDRRPWLHELADWIGEQEALGASTAMACSALRRSYRDILRAAAPGVCFLHMDGPAEVILGRLEARSGHFMPSALLQSQLQTLEPLEPDEEGREFDVRADSDTLAGQALEYVRERMRGTGA